MVKSNSLVVSFILSSVLLFSGTLLHAQDIFTRLKSAGNNNAVVSVIQDENLVRLLNFHLTQQKAMNGVKGYRISIYLGSGQEASKNADMVKSKFISKHEDIPSYKVFIYPFYNIHVGNFRTKSEALKFLEIIQKEYPDAFIREDVIALSD